MKTKSLKYLLTCLLPAFLMISWNKIKPQNTLSNNLEIKKSLKIDSCACKDSFYVAVLEKATIDAYHGDRRLHFDFYESKNDCLDSFKIEGWHKDNGTGLGHDPAPINLLQLPLAVTLNNPYHFRDVEISMHDIDALIRTIPNPHPQDCDYQIRLTPFQDAVNNCLNINAQIFYDCSHAAIKTYTGGTTIQLNPCPPKQPQ